MGKGKGEVESKERGVRSVDGPTLLPTLPSTPLSLPALACLLRAWQWQDTLQRDVWRYEGGMVVARCGEGEA